MAGEIGGIYEEIAADYIKKMKKPVIAYITGVHAPQGKRMGHAGAIIEGDIGTAASKIRALTDANALIADTLGAIPQMVKDVLRK